MKLSHQTPSWNAVRCKEFKAHLCRTLLLRRWVDVLLHQTAEYVAYVSGFEITSAEEADQ
jgi:hypothetical protein